MDKDSCKSWDDAKKSALVAQIVSGKLSVKAACERHDLSPETIQDWVRVFRRTTLQAFDEHLRQMFLIQGADAAALGTAEYTGTLDDIPVGDLIQTFQMGGKGGVITITHDGQRSQIWCDKGEIVDAASGPLRGAAAIYRILSFERGQVLADFRSEPRERTVELPANVLLLEAARRHDECRRLIDRLGGQLAIYRPAALPAVPVNRAERQLFALCDGVRSLRDVVEQSDLGDLETLHVLASLIERRQLLQCGLSLPAQPPVSAVTTVSADAPNPAVSFLPLVASQEPAPMRRPTSPLAFVAVGMAFGIAVWVGSSLFTQNMPPPAPARGVAALEPPPAGQTAARTFELDSTVSPPHAELWLDGVKVGAGRLQRRLPRDGAPHALRIVAEGYAPTTLLFADAPPPPHIELEPFFPAARKPAAKGPSSELEAAGEGSPGRSPAAPPPAGPAPSADGPGEGSPNAAAAGMAAQRAAARRPNAAPRPKRAAPPAKAVERTAAGPDDAESGETDKVKGPRVQIIEDDVPVVQVIE